ncbi:MAG: thermonuclease family protein, partial [Zetaproteobacteria bacterium]|nr:thermonuclease family protein [Zetaproteobacteria bacterium]
VVSQQQWVTVAQVFDGDTFKTTSGEKVRLLNINTPEVMHDKQPSEPLSESAKLYLKSLVDGKMVRLEFDQERRDIYGRLLAHVYLSDGTWVNQALLQKGLAHIYTFAPNFKHVTQLRVYERFAIEKGLGIWGVERFAMVPSRQVNANQVGEFHLIEGRVEAIEDRGWGFRSGNLRVSIPKKYRNLFPDAPFFNMPKQQLLRFRGRIFASQQNGLYLALHSPFDMEMIQ